MIFNSKRYMISAFIISIGWLLLKVWGDADLFLVKYTGWAMVLFVVLCLPLYKNYKILVNTEEIILYRILKSNIVIKVDEVRKIEFEKTFAPPYNRNMLYVHTNKKIYDLNVSSINVKELMPYLKQIADIKGIQFISKKI